MRLCKILCIYGGRNVEQIQHQFLQCHLSNPQHSFQMEQLTWYSDDDDKDNNNCEDNNYKDNHNKENLLKDKHNKDDHNKDIQDIEDILAVFAQVVLSANYEKLSGHSKMGHTKMDCWWPPNGHCILQYFIQG